MRILFVAPRSEFPDVTPGWLRIPQMSLLILEALCGSEHEVRTVEEEIEPVPMEQHWDLVGITVMTATAMRAYYLANMFRQRGSKVVLGGVHVSLMQEEAAAHADAVVVGEAEDVWGRVLDDARHNRLQPVYVNLHPDISRMPLVHYKSKKGLFTPNLAPVVATRGCPQGCEFCSVPTLYGYRMRHLSVQRVLEQVRCRRANMVAFLDDNLASNRSWAAELFAGLKQLNLKFIFQIPVSFILDEELFVAAVAAGLKGVFVGIETIDEKALANYRKSVCVESYVNAIHRCRSAGVMFHASLIFGMDEHDGSIFDQTLDFIAEHRIPSVSAYVLTPYPGTALFNRMTVGGRLLHQNWAYYDHVTPVFRPSRMSFEELASGYMRFRESLFSFGAILNGLPAQLGCHPLAYLGLKIGFKRTTRLLKEHYRRYFVWLKEVTASELSEGSYDRGAFKDSVKRKWYNRFGRS